MLHLRKLVASTSCPKVPPPKSTSRHNPSRRVRISHSLPTTAAHRPPANMEDPWAAWGTPKKAAPADTMRMPRMSMSPPAPEPADLDPWAKPTPAKAPPPRRTPSPASSLSKLPVPSPPRSPSKLSLSTLPSPPISTGLGFPSASTSTADAMPKLSGWDDVGWGTGPAKQSALPGENRLAARSPSPVLDAGWGASSPPAAPSHDEDDDEPERETPPVLTSALELERSPSPQRSPSPTRSSSSLPPTSPRKSLDALARITGEALPRLSLEADAFSRPSSARPSAEVEQRPVSISPPPPISAVAFDTAELGEGFATPFGPSSPKATAPEIDADISAASLVVPEPSELRRSPSFGSDFGGFADGEVEGGWGDTSWKDDGGDDAGTSAWKPEETSGGWGEVPRAPSPVKPNAQELEWEAAQRRMAAADARAPYERIQALRKGWEDVATAVIGDNTLETSEEEERKLDEGARELQENVYVPLPRDEASLTFRQDTLRSMTEVPSTTFAFAASVTRERYAQALARAPPNAMSLLRQPVRSRRQDAALDFGPGLEGWAARSRLGEPEAAPAAAAQPEQTAKGWSFWRRQTTPKPLVTSGGGILEVKTDVDAASLASGNGSGRPSTSRAGSIASASVSRPETPLEQPAVQRQSTSTPDVLSARASISSGPPIQPQLSGAQPSQPPAADKKVQELKDSAPAPSRMSRLFRWGGRKAPETTADENEDKELELGENDFAFLDQVPSAMAAGTGDLLGGGMSSIDDVLGPVRKDVPLPAPLAPPPRSGSAGLSAPGSGASGSVRPPPRKNDFDLLAGLDFDDSSPAPSAPAAGASTSAFAWDDLLAPSSSTPSSSAVPQLAPSLGASAMPQRTATPPVMGMGTLVPSRPSSASPKPTQAASFASFSPPPPPKPAGYTSPPITSPTPHSPPRRVAPVMNPPTPERPRYGPSGPALGRHSRHRSGMNASSSSTVSAATPKVQPQPAPAPAADMFGFGDLSFAPLEPTAPAQPAAATSNDFGFGSMAASTAPAASASSNLGFGNMMAPMAPSPPPASGGMPSMVGMGMAALAPSPPPAQRTSSPFALAPPPSASPAPPQPAPAAAPAAAEDDFGDFEFTNFAAPSSSAADDDFGDFGDFGSSSAPQASGGDDGFGDFSSFGTFSTPMTPAKGGTSSLAPTPIAKSIPPTPIEKSPRPLTDFGLAPSPTPPASIPFPAPPTSFPSLTPGAPASLSRNSSLSRSGAGGSLSRTSSLSRTASHSPPVFARPAGLPVGLTPAKTKSRQSSFADNAARAQARASVAATSPTPAGTAGSRRTPSVDHRATLTLLAAAQAADAASEEGPMSPVPEALSPPPGGGFMIPPPPGGGRSRPRGGGGLIDLLDD